MRVLKFSDVGQIPLFEMHAVASQPEFVFWLYDDRKHLVISPTRLYDFLNKFGNFFINARNPDKKDNLIIVSGNVIKRATIDDLKRTTLDFIELIEDKEFLHDLKDALFAVIKYFRPDYWYNLPTKNFKYSQDRESCANFYFRNGTITITSDNITFSPQYDVIIYEDQIHDCKIKLLDDGTDMSNFAFNRFLHAITYVEGDETLSQQRYHALISLIGYLLHTARKPTDKAIIFTDIDQSDCNGGTGKSLIVNALSKCRKTVKEDAKLFHIKNRFAYQSVTMGSNILCFDDAPKDFDFESLFSAITEGLNVEKKFKDKIRIPKEDSPKIIITTNYSIKGHGVSFERRKLEFEISNYFNDKRSPLTEYGQRFFEDWDTDEWNKFYMIMFSAVQQYLKTGILISKEMNLKHNKLINLTNKEFAEYFNLKIETNREYDKTVEYNSFKKLYSEYSFVKQRTFHNWLDTTAKIFGYKLKTNHSGYKRVFVMEDSKS
jgi:hypothetical protein